MSIVFVGIDLAKNVFAVHGIDVRVAQYDRHLAPQARADDRAQRLMRLNGIAATTATALVAVISRAVALQERRGYWRAVVAIVAKNARMAWAVLAKAERFVMPT